MSKISRHKFNLSTKYARKPPAELPPYWDNIEDPEAEIKQLPPRNWPKKPVYPEPYRAKDELMDVVNLAIASGRPLLLQGDPGCGKTRLAFAVAYELGLPLFECYIKSTSRAQDLLYTYDAVKRLYDAQLGAACPKDDEGQPRCETSNITSTMAP